MGEWQLNPSVLSAKGDMSVRASVLPLHDNGAHGESLGPLVTQ